MNISKLPLLAIACSTVLAGCSSYRGLPHPIYVRSGQPLTAELVNYQVSEAQPRCRQVARETNPSRGRAAAAGFANGVIGGIIGGAGNNVVQSIVLGTGVTATSVAATAGGAAVFSGAVGAVQGAARSDEVRHLQTNGCLAQEAGGIIQVPPSEAREVQQSGQARTYGRGTANGVDPSVTTTIDPNN